MESESWFRRKQTARREHKERMYRAAGVNSVQLICHADTWRQLDWFWGTFSDHPARVPNSRVKDRGDGSVAVILSGPSLVTLLKLTHRPTFGPDRRALAKRTYEQLATVIDAVDPNAKPGQAIPPVVLDDKLPDAASS